MGDPAGDDEDSAPPPAGRFARTFVVRIWIEALGPLDPGAPVLRGTLSELGGKRLGAFNSLAGLVALLERAFNLQQPH